jgi:hypothetical protein
MLIFETRRWIQAPFASEDELECVVRDNAEAIFGPSSIYFPKMLFKTGDGAGSVPDGFVIDIAARQWFVVEVELSRHGVWTHIAPQVARQIIASTQPISKQLLVEWVVERAREENGVLEKFAELGIEALDVRRVLAEILDARPIVGIPIDAVSRDLHEWAQSVKNEVKLWVVKKYVEWGAPQNVLYEVPDENRPTVDTHETGRAGLARYDITLLDLVRAGLLNAGDRLYLSYAPRSGGRKRAEAKTYVSVVQPNGALEVLENLFSSPSYAALYAIQDAGSKRTTANGWVAWKTITGEPLATLREAYFDRQSSLTTEAAGQEAGLSALDAVERSETKQS